MRYAWLYLSHWLSYVWAVYCRKSTVDFCGDSKGFTS